MSNHHATDGHAERLAREVATRRAASVEDGLLATAVAFLALGVWAVVTALCGGFQ